MTEFEEVIADGAAGLSELEFWCITHVDGDVIATASKDLTMPVRTFCDALGLDWDEAVDMGYTLGRTFLTEEQLSEIPTERLLGGLAKLMNSNRLDD